MIAVRDCKVFQAESHSIPNCVYMRAATYMELHPIIPHRSKHLIVGLCAIVSFILYTVSVCIFIIVFSQCLSLSPLPLFLFRECYFFVSQIRSNNLSTFCASKECSCVFVNAQIEFRVDFVLDSTFRVTIESNLNAYSSL